MTDWNDYRKCTTCYSEIGEPCMSLRGLLAGSGPVEVPLDEPHGGRELRAGVTRA